MNMAEEDETVLSFNDSIIRKSDMQLLDGPYWLNDRLIEFCFEYFEKEQFNHSADKLCLIGPDVTQFIKLAPAEEIAPFLEPLNLPEKQFIFLAVNNNQSCDKAGGTHWSLLVYIRNIQEFRHYDSQRGSNTEEARNLAYKLQPYVHAPMGRMKFLEQDSPQQQNGYDCGVFVIATAEHLCKELCEGYNISLMDMVNPSSVTKKRQQIMELIHHTAREYGS